MINHDQSEYFLGSLLKSKPGHSSYYYVRPITAVHMYSISNALGRLGDFETYCGLYEMCEKNYQSILSYHSTIKDDFPTNRDRSYEYMREAFQEITRLFLNYLSSFRTFVDHLETKYKRLECQGYPFFAHYDKITAACYDNHFSYRFFTKLRNFVQHCGLPFGEVAMYEQLTEEGEC
jgi:hypothetical protein